MKQETKTKFNLRKFKALLKEEEKAKAKLNKFASRVDEIDED